MGSFRRFPDADTPTTGLRPPRSVEDTCAMLAATRTRAAILVEGWSDQAAVETLALRRNVDLPAERICVVPMGGITNVARFAQAIGPQGMALHIAGLCDAAEEVHVARCLSRLGIGEAQTREQRERTGFFVCEVDLEDELIRAAGTDVVERVIEAEGELPSFRIFQDQAAQQGRSTHAQLRRFMGTRARRKIRYGSLLIEALRPEQVPRSLGLVLDHHRAGSTVRSRG